MARKFLNGIHISGTTQIDFMPTHESEGILTLGRFDSNTSRYHNIKSYVSSTEASNYLKFSLHASTENAVVDVLTLKGNKDALFSGNIQATSYIQSDNNFLAKGDIKFRNNADSSWNGGQIGTDANDALRFAVRTSSSSNVQALSIAYNTLAATFEGKIVPNAHIELPYGSELRTLDSNGAARTIARASSNKLQYGWSYAGAVEFMGGGSYTPRITINTDGSTTFAGDVKISTGKELIIGSQTTAGSPLGITIRDDQGNVPVGIQIHNENTGTGADASIAFETQAAMDFSIGLDRSDSSKFVMSRAGTLGTNNVFTIDGTAATFTGKMVVGDATNQHQWIVNKAVSGYYSGIKLTRGAGNNSNPANNNHVIWVSDTGLNLGKTNDATVDSFSNVSTHLTLNASGNATFAGDVILGTGDNLYLSGTSGFRILHDGSNALFINQTAGDIKIQNSATDKDIIFRGQDGASTIDALTLDMSDGGWATFNSGIHVANTFSPSTFGNATFAGNVTLNTGTNKILSVLASTHNASVAAVATLALGYTHSGGDAFGRINLVETANNSFDANMHFSVPHNNGSGGSTSRTALTLLGSTLNATFAGNVSLGDDKELIFGAATDYKIYHNSTTNVNHISSLIDRQLSINANIIQLTNQANSTTYLKLESTGALFAGTITTGDNSNDNYISATFSDSSYTRIHGYGLYMSRSNSYIRPTTDTGKTLYIGSSDKRWDNVNVHATNATFAGNLTVTGNLTISGTTTTLNTQTVEVEDNILQLNTTQGSPDTATATTSGISIYRGDGVTQASLIFDDADDTWDLTNNLKIAGSLNVGPGPSRFTDQQNAGSRLELYNNRQDAGNVEVYRIAAYNAAEVAGVHFYRGGGGNSGYTKIFAKKSNASSLEEVVQFGQDNALTTTFAGDVILPTTKALYLDGGGGTYIYESSDGVIDFYGDTVQLLTAKQNGTQSEVVVNEGSGDVDFRVEANNNTHAFFVEAEGSGKVGVGTIDPAFQLHVDSAENGVTAIGVSNTGSGASRVYLDASNGDFAGSDYMWIGQNNDLSGEIFMPQSSGSFHIKTQPGGTATSQFSITQAGLATFAGEVNVASGKISILGGNNLTISGTASNHAGISFGTNIIYPATAAGTNDNTFDLGDPDERFKDAYFGGTVSATNFKIGGAQGSDGQVLTSTGSGVAWEDASGGSTFNGGTVANATTFSSAVGIGAAAASGMLDVKGADTNNAVLARFYSNTGARGSFIIRNGSGVSPTTFIGTAGGSEQLSIGTNNTEAIRLDASQKATFAGDARFNQRVRIGDVTGLSNRGAVRIDTRGDAPADLLYGRDTAGTATGWTGVYWGLSSRGSGEGNAFKVYRGNGHNSPYNSEAVALQFDPDLKATFGGNVTVNGTTLNLSGTSYNFVTSAANVDIGVSSSAHNVAGYTTLLYAGSPTAGTTNNIAGGHLYLAGGAGKGTGAGGDIIFRVAPVGSSGSSVNAYTTALTISDDKSATFGGDVIISSAGTGASPCLRINNLSHTTFNHGIEVYNANLVAGESEIILVGKAGSTKNSGYIGYNWAANASNNNYVTIGQYGANHIFRVYGDQVLSTVTLRSQSDVRGTLFYDIDDTTYYLNPNSTGTSLNAAGTLAASISNMSSYQLNGTTVMDSSRNLVNIAGITSTSNATLGNSTTDKVAISGNLGLGDLTHPKIAYPGKAASWDGSGTTTGQIVIDLPGTLGNYDMMYMEIDIYEYSSDAASKIIIGGHNWNSGGNSNTGTTQWHNAGVQVIGSITKSVYLGRRNDGTSERRCIAIGEINSTWSYGVVHVSKISGACYYTDTIDWLGDWNVDQTTSGTYFTKNPTTNFNSQNGQTLRTPGYLQAGGSVRAPIFYDSGDSSFYSDMNGQSVLYNLRLSGAKHTYLEISPGSSHESMVRYMGSAGSSWYVGKRTATANGITTSDFHWYSEAASATVGGINTGGHLKTIGSIQTPIFYDSNDTAYFLDPNATGTSLKVAGKIEHKGIEPTAGTNIDQIKEFSMSFQLSADTWTDTGINATDLVSGTYVVQMYVQDYGVGGGHYTEFYSGMMSWWSADTNDSNVDEILLHRAGHAPQSGTIQLRTERTLTADTNDLMLQVKHNVAYSAALDNSNSKFMRFKFRRLI